MLQILLIPLVSTGQEVHLESETEADVEAETDGDVPSIYDTLVFDQPIPISDAVAPPMEEYSQRYLENSEPEPYPAQMRNIQNYEQTINDIEYQGGAWDPGLTEPLRDLGAIYAEQGTHELAVDAYARAMHVSRVNAGLDSLEQIPMVESMIDSYLALGDWDKADQYQNYLYYTQRKAFGLDDPRMVPVLDRMASWNLRVFNARWGEAVGLRLHSAYYLLRAASRIVSVHFGPEDERYLNYLRDTAGTAYLISRYQGLIEEATRPEFNSVQDMYVDQLYKVRPINERGYQEGLQALQQVVEYYAEHAPRSEEHARAVVHEADWYLLFERRRTAAQAYSDAWQMMQALENGPELIQEIFGSVTPLPQFSDRIKALTTTADIEQRAPNARQAGFIDIEFDVTPYGAVLDLEVLNEDETLDARVLSVLRRAVRDTTFRPRLENGEAVRSDNNRLRYPYWY